MTEALKLNLPKISIVMPSYNQEDFLGDAIDSILNQDYPSIELIVIDGGSSDASVQVLERFSDRLAFWSSEPDKGQSDALNKGFEKASGDIVGWLNSDDTFQPGTFKQVADTFKDEQVFITMCRTFGMMDTKGTVFEFKDNQFNSYHHLVRYWATNGMTINQPCVFMRRSVLQGLNPVLDPGLHYAMDYDLWLRITRDHPIKIIEGYWANYRFHDTSKSGISFKNFFPEWLAVSRRHWGKPGSLSWWKFQTDYLLHHHLLRRVKGMSRRILKLHEHG